MTPLRRVLLLLSLALVGVAAGAGAILAALEGLESAGRRYSELSLPWLGMAWLVWLSSAWAQGRRWHALLPVEGLTGEELGKVLLGANVLNLALPGPVGELGAAWYLYREHGVPLPMGLSSTLLGRFVALLVYGAVTLSLWPFLEVPEATGRWLGPLTGVLALGTLPLLVLFRPTLLLRPLGWLGRLPGGADLEQRFHWWIRCFGALGKLGTGRWLQAAGWSLVNVGVLGTAGYCCFAAADVEARPLGALFVQVFTALVSVAAVILPSGLGAVDLAFVSVFPVAAEGTMGDAVLCAAVVRVVQLGSLAAGIPAMLLLLARLPEAQSPEAVERLRQLVKNL